MTIKRGADITVPELEAATVNDAEFTPVQSATDTDGGVFALAWQPPGVAQPELFVLEGGVVNVTSPSNPALIKIQSLASTLGASVSGEEGENLSNVHVSGETAAGCGPAVWTFFVLAIVLIGYWLLQ